MNLPAAFSRTIVNTFGEAGREFLMALPALVDEAARRWDLTDIEPVANLSYNFVALARRHGEEVVLKLGVPNAELASEMTALRLFDGQAAVRLLEADAMRGMCLLERPRPGAMLDSVKDDARATEIAADIILVLRREAPVDNVLIHLTDWFKGFDRLRLRFGGGTGPLPRALIERAETGARDFFAEAYVPVLMHGDLHHFNILSSDRGWLAIDPKGVVGPAAYEVGPLLINPWIVSGLQPDTRRLTQQRVLILAERLGIERQRIWEWAIAHAMLSAWWSLADGEDWQRPVEFARLLAEA